MSSISPSIIGLGLASVTVVALIFYMRSKIYKQRFAIISQSLIEHREAIASMYLNFRHHMKFKDDIPFSDIVDLFEESYKETYVYHTYTMRDYPSDVIVNLMFSGISYSGYHTESEFMEMLQEYNHKHKTSYGRF